MNMSLNLESMEQNYGMNKAVTEGKEFQLDGNPEYKFLIRVPSEYNYAFNNAISDSFRMKEGDDGTVVMDGSFGNFKEVRRRGFVEHCMVSINSDPVPSDFLSRFPKAVDELMTKAQAVADEIDKRVEDAVKK